MFILILLLAVASVSNAGTSPLREKMVHAVIPSTLSAPMLIVKDNEPPSGIMPATLKVIAEHLGRKLSPVLAPKNRIDEYMKTRDIDLNCFTNPTWVPDPKDFYWSDPLFSKREVIFGAKPMPKTVQGLHGKTLGTVLGYKYPKLDSYFESKKIFREDASDEMANIIKINRKRISYIVVDEMVLKSEIRKHPRLELKRESLLNQEYPIHCALSKKSTIKLSQLNKVIEHLKSMNSFETIFKKY